jgi:hypothetical protein
LATGVITRRIMITGATKADSRTKSVDLTMWSPLLIIRRNLANPGDSKTLRIYPAHGTRIHLTRQASARTSRIILRRMTRPRARVRKTITTRVRRIKETRGGCNTPVLSLHFALAFHEHKHHPFIHEHEHVNCILNVA